jgi:predicted SnoaL-like aldol condensation-catalyzing enzyme
MNKPQISQELLQSKSWTPVETQNVATIAEFMQLLMNEHNFEKVLSKFSFNQYTQHNRNIPDGFSNLVKYVQEFAKKFPEYSYDVKRITADGDYVTFHSHVTTKASHRGNDSKGFNIIDTWKLENGQITKHWDAIQPLDFFMRLYVWLTGGASKTITVCSNLICESLALVVNHSVFTISNLI